MTVLRAGAWRSAGRCAVPSASLLPTLLPATAFAADAVPDPGVAASLLPTTAGLAIVLLLIFGVAWLLRRTNTFGARARGLMRIVATEAVGQRERVVVLEIGDQWLVLGVAAGRVSALHAMPRGSLPEAPPATDSFASLLSRALSRRRS